MTSSFGLENALGYERQSAALPRTYELATQALINTDGGIQNGETVVEIGSGTGNSSIILARSNPGLAKLICVEPSGHIELAAYKLGKTSNRPLNSDPDFSEALNYIKEQRQKALPVREKIILVKGKAPKMPLADAIADRVYAVQSFHWLAFPDEESPADYDHLSKGVADIARILRPGGRLLFDSNGHIFDFGNIQRDGKQLNDIHYVNHPLYKQFDYNFLRIAAQREVEIEEAPDRLRQIFNLDLLKDILNKNSLKLSPQQNDELFSVTLLPVSRARIITSLIDGTQMHAFRHKGLKELPTDQKNDIINQALQKTLLVVSKNDKDQYFETLVSFAAEKI